MLYGLLILLLTIAASYQIIAHFSARHPRIDLELLRGLIFYHFALALVYYLYATFNPSDSHYYYIKLVDKIRGESWFDYYATSTAFIEFLGYPFVNFLGFSYEAMMVLFAFFGFVGFIYFYIFFRENIHFTHKFAGFEVVALLFYLPNVHFWSSSFGKGGVILMGIGMFFYALTNLRTRWITFVFACILIYHVRPHVLLVMLVSSMIGFVFTNKGLSTSFRVLFLTGAGVCFYFIYGSVFKMVGIDENEFVSQGLNLSGRARELSKSTSGVDINQYSLPMKLFTFVYRPLFVDAPGILGIIVSFENAFYLLFTARLFTFKGIKFLAFSNFIVKTALFSFLTVSIALAQVSGNLGLAMRQKSQVMLLFLFLVVSLMDAAKLKEYQRTVRVRSRTRARSLKVEQHT